MSLRPIYLLLIVLAISSASCAAPTPQPTLTLSHPTATRSATPASTATSAVPSATATVPPAPRFFTEEFNAKPAYWSFLQVDNGQAALSPGTRDGFLVFDLPSPNEWAYAMYGGNNYTDVTVEAETQFRTDGDGSVGLVCRYDEQAGWYEFNIYADHTYQLLFGQWLAQGVARYTPLYQATSDQIQADTNQIGLRCQGNALTPFINGVQTRTWQELKYGLQSGKVGLAASSFEDSPFTVAFDWARVTEP